VTSLSIGVTPRYINSVTIVARTAILSLAVAVLLCLSLASAMPGMDMGHALVVCCALAVVVLSFRLSQVGMFRSVVSVTVRGRAGSAHELDRLTRLRTPPDRVALRSLLL
jgi:hypothetical protein